MNKQKFKLMDEGLTSSEISEKLKQPESIVMEWMAIILAVRQYDNTRL